MKLQVDRTLPVPLGTQLRGLIEYGVVNGDLLPGQRLPSVRELAEALDIAPMTVAQVYRTLRDAGVLETRSGDGTFIAKREHHEQRHVPADLQQRVDSVISDALAAGLSPRAISGMVQVSLSRSSQVGATRRVVMLGMFEDATREYAAILKERLGPAFEVEPHTLTELRAHPQLAELLSSAELVITFSNRAKEVATLLPAARVTALRFLPSEATRQALASLDPYVKLVVVSHFAEFLPILKAGVVRFAPHVGSVQASVLNAPGMMELLNWGDAVVYSTGAESLLAHLRDGVVAIEYRHGPDPVDIDQTILPILDPGSASLRSAS
jgi:Predicted transcriptional regulators